MTQGEASGTRVVQPGDSIRLVGYLCYPSDIRLTASVGEDGIIHHQLSGFTLCDEASVGRCALHRGMQGEGVGNCHHVEISINVAYKEE